MHLKAISQIAWPALILLSLQLKAQTLPYPQAQLRVAPGIDPAIWTQGALSKLLPESP